MDEPLVGETPTYEVGENEVPWILGTQLTTRAGPLVRAGPDCQVLMIEAQDFAARRQYHYQKLVLVFSAMRAFRDRLERAGYDVRYIRTGSFSEGLSAFFSARPDATLVAMPSPSYGSQRRLQELVEDAGGEIRFVENDLFASTDDAFDEWAGHDPDDGSETKTFTHEQFYRWMRRETGVLMEDGDPVGGEWNYDDENRRVPPEDWDAPPVPEHDYCDRTMETAAWVDATFDTWGKTDMAAFSWPVTRPQARRQLSHFLTERLSEFGPYQDAMRREHWAMAHSLVGAAINLGLLHPSEVITETIAAFDSGDYPLHSVEGFIRQVLGWREFCRHVYRHTMPALATANQLGATRDLPGFYWSGETEMNCLAETLGDVHDRGYSHHIQRLMILANFATLWGVTPSELNEWFHATYVDAYHWVTTPNVVEMGQYGHGVFATKPYVASSNYVEKMSDYCSSCQYEPSENTGERACPFNALYWDFLARNEEQLRSNYRMGLLFGHIDDKRESGEFAAIRERVESLRELERRESL